MKLLPQNSLLLILDVQEKLTPHIYDYQNMLNRIQCLVKGFQALDIPMAINEQYKKGLGETVKEIAEFTADYPHFEKVSFSGLADSNTAEFIQQSQKQQIILCGIESHICVLQTALDLIEKGLQPVIVWDAVGSRKIEDKELAKLRLINAGAILTSTESILFELCQSAKNPTFKIISQLVK